MKWSSTPFDSHDLATLQRSAGQIPGFTPGRSGLVVVSREGVDLPPEAVDVRWSPDDLLEAWRSGG